MNPEVRHAAVTLGSPTFVTACHGPFLLTEAWFPSGLTLPAHTHDRTVVAVTLNGRWDSVMAGTPYESQPGSLLTEPVAERHANHFGPAGARVIIIQPDPAADDLLHPCRELLGAIHSFPLPGALRLARKLSAELKQTDDLAALASHGLSLELLALAASRRRPADARGSRWLPRVEEHLRASFLERPTVSTLAAIAGVHPAHLTRAFRARFGSSPAEHVRRLRLEWSAHKLAAGEESIASIASAAGFADQSHFTRAFRRFSGTSPARYRADRR